MTRCSGKKTSRGSGKSSLSLGDGVVLSHNVKVLASEFPSSLSASSTIGESSTMLSRIGVALSEMMSSGMGVALSKIMSPTGRMGDDADKVDGGKRYLGVDGSVECRSSSCNGKPISLQKIALLSAPSLSSSFSKAGTRCDSLIEG